MTSRRLLKEDGGTKIKYSSVNLSSAFKGSNVKNTAPTTTRPGLQVLGRAKGNKLSAQLTAAPLPLNLPSLRAENAGLDPTTRLVPSGKGGWGGSSQQSPSQSHTPTSQTQPSPKQTPPSLLTKSSSQSMSDDLQLQPRSFQERPPDSLQDHSPSPVPVQPQLPSSQPQSKSSSHEQQQSLPIEANSPPSQPQAQLSQPTSTSVLSQPSPVQTHEARQSVRSLTGQDAVNADATHTLMYRVKPARLASSPNTSPTDVTGQLDGPAAPWTVKGARPGETSTATWPGQAMEPLPTNTEDFPSLEHVQHQSARSKRDYQPVKQNRGVNTFPATQTSLPMTPSMPRASHTHQLWSPRCPGGMIYPGAGGAVFNQNTGRYRPSGGMTFDRPNGHVPPLNSGRYAAHGGSLLGATPYRNQGYGYPGLAMQQEQHYEPGRPLWPQQTLRAGSGPHHIMHPPVGVPRMTERQQSDVARPRPSYPILRTQLVEHINKAVAKEEEGDDTWAVDEEMDYDQQVTFDDDGKSTKRLAQKSLERGPGQFSPNMAQEVQDQEGQSGVIAKRPDTGSEQLSQEDLSRSTGTSTMHSSHAALLATPVIHAAIDRNSEWSYEKPSPTSVPGDAKDKEGQEIDGINGEDPGSVEILRRQWLEDEERREKKRKEGAAAKLAALEQRLQGKDQTMTSRHANHGEAVDSTVHGKTSSSGGGMNVLSEAEANNKEPDADCTLELDADCHVHGKENNHNDKPIAQDSKQDILHANADAPGQQGSLLAEETLVVEQTLNESSQSSEWAKAGQDDTSSAKDTESVAEQPISKIEKKHMCTQGALVPHPSSNGENDNIAIKHHSSLTLPIGHHAVESALDHHSKEDKSHVGVDHGGISFDMQATNVHYPILCVDHLESSTLSREHQHERSSESRQTNNHHASASLIPGKLSGPVASAGVPQSRAVIKKSFSNGRDAKPKQSHSAKPRMTRKNDRDEPWAWIDPPSQLLVPSTLPVCLPGGRVVQVDCQIMTKPGSGAVPVGIARAGHRHGNTQATSQGGDKTMHNEGDLTAMMDNKHSEAGHPGKAAVDFAISEKGGVRTGTRRKEKSPKSEWSVDDVNGDESNIDRDSVARDTISMERAAENVGNRQPSAILYVPSMAHGQEVSASSKQISISSAGAAIPASLVSAAGTGPGVAREKDTLNDMPKLRPTLNMQDGHVATTINKSLNRDVVPSQKSCLPENNVDEQKRAKKTPEIPVSGQSYNPQQVNAEVGTSIKASAMQTSPCHSFNIHGVAAHSSHCDDVNMSGDLFAEADQGNASTSPLCQVLAEEVDQSTVAVTSNQSSWPAEPPDDGEINHDQGTPIDLPPMVSPNLVPVGQTTAPSIGQLLPIGHVELDESLPDMYMPVCLATSPLYGQNSNTETVYLTQGGPAAVATSIGQCVAPENLVLTGQDNGSGSAVPSVGFIDVPCALPDRAVWHLPRECVYSQQQAEVDDHYPMVMSTSAHMAPIYERVQFEAGQNQIAQHMSEMAAYVDAAPFSPHNISTMVDQSSPYSFYTPEVQQDSEPCLYEMAPQMDNRDGQASPYMDSNTLYRVALGSLSTQEPVPSFSQMGMIPNKNGGGVPLSYWPSSNDQQSVERQQFGSQPCSPGPVAYTPHYYYAQAGSVQHTATGLDGQALLLSATEESCGKIPVATTMLETEQMQPTSHAMAYYSPGGLLYSPLQPQYERPGSISDCNYGAHSPMSALHLSAVPMPNEPCLAQPINRQAAHNPTMLGNMPMATMIGMPVNGMMQTDLEPQSRNGWTDLPAQGQLRPTLFVQSEYA